MLHFILCHHGMCIRILHSQFMARFTVTTWEQLLSQGRCWEVDVVWCHSSSWIPSPGQGSRPGPPWPDKPGSGSGCCHSALRQSYEMAQTAAPSNSSVGSILLAVTGVVGWCSRQGKKLHISDRIPMGSCKFTTEKIPRDQNFNFSTKVS